MRIRTIARVSLVLAAGAVTAFALTGCSGAPAVNPSAIATINTVPEILTLNLPDDVSAKGVVFAAILLKTGDVEAAINHGLVTPAEVEEARKAITDGTLKFWEQRAEQDQ